MLEEYKNKEKIVSTFREMFIQIAITEVQNIGSHAVEVSKCYEDMEHPSRLPEKVAWKPH